jgi:hypothetical protein
MHAEDFCVDHDGSVAGNLVATLIGIGGFG